MTPCTDEIFRQWDKVSIVQFIEIVKENNFVKIDDIGAWMEWYFLSIFLIGNRRENGLRMKFCREIASTELREKGDSYKQYLE